MRIFEPSVDVTVKLPFVDDEGASITPTGLDYTIVNEFGVEVVTTTNIPVIPTTGEVEITVEGVNNDLAVDAVRGYRQIILTMTTAADSIIIREGYIIELSASLVLLTNSFQTYEEALLNSREIILEGWNAANEEHRRSAMAQAYDRFGGFKWQFNFTNDTYQVKTLDLLTAAEWALLDSRHTHDFRMAQLAQADYHLDGSTIEKDIDDGLQSSSQGEVSQFYRPRATLTLALSRHALQYVGKYINWTPTITRT
ncbi:MAG: hypothetical protein KAJ19_20575 [Gammaproteobacteria bacterium]|nr:hypothetical protein [Gammaproteobacteria bacterium]